MTINPTPVVNQHQHLSPVTQPCGSLPSPELIPGFRPRRYSCPLRLIIAPSPRGHMKPISWLGVVLIIVGVVLLSGRLSYTRDSESVSVGPVEVVAKRKAEIPRWTGLVLLVAGAGLMLAGARRT